mgnify:FL=1
MADTPEQKKLDEIKNKLAANSKTTEELKNILEENYRAFPAASFRGMLESTKAEIMEQRQILQYGITIGDILDNANNDQENSQYNALSKFLGVDYRSEHLGKLDKIGDGFNEIKDGLGKLAKGLGLDKVAKKVGGFWDFLKNILAAGLATVGLLEFLEGWNKADEIFGKNADTSEKISAGLASALGTFLGLSEGEIKDLAFKIDEILTGIFNFLTTEFDAITATVRSSFDEFKTIFEGFKMVFDGDFTGGIKAIGEGFAGLAVELYNSESILAKAILAVAAVKVVTTVAALFTSIGTVFSTLSTIAAGLGTAFAAIGGTAGLVAFASTVGTVLLPAFAVLAAVFAALAAIPAMIEGFGAGMDEFEKTGSIMQAVTTGLGKFIESFFENFITFASLGFLDGADIVAKTKKIVGDIFEPINSFFDNVIVALQRMVAKAAGFFGFDPEDIGLGDARGLQEDASMSYDADFNRSGIVSNYDQLKDAVEANEELSRAERKKQLQEIVAAQNSGRDFGNFVANTQNSTINQLNIKAKPQQQKTQIPNGATPNPHTS